MKEISLCMIIKNEEQTIARCLDSVKDLVDEIIIVDTGSTDKSKEIVSKYTDKIYDFEWVEDFAKARNFSFSKATKDYIMWLDADDIILEEDREKFRKLKPTIGDADIYMFVYNYSFDANGTPKVIQNRARLLKREKNYTWVSPIHEVIIPTGNIVYTDICITHKKIQINERDRNMRIFKKMIQDGIKFDNRQQYAYAKEYKYSNNIDQAIIEYKKLIDEHIDEYENNKHFMYKSLIDISDCYKIKGDIKKEKEALMTIISNQEPYIKVSAKLGDLFFREKSYDAALFWLKYAVSTDKKTEEANEYDHYFLPYLEIGICYYYKNDYENAMKYNEMAGNLRPDDSAYKKNKEIYEKKLKNNF